MRQWVLLGLTTVLMLVGLWHRPPLTAALGVAATRTAIAMQVSDFLPPIHVTPGSAARPPVWDPRLDDYNVTYHPAADCSQGCWELARAEFLDEGQSGGLHHVFAKSLSADGQHLGGTPWRVAWAGGMDLSTTKPPPDWGDLALWDCYFPDQGEAGGYRAWMGTTESRSDVVRGMGLPYCIHTSFRLTWQWNPGGPPTPTIPPTATLRPTPSGDIHYAAIPMIYGGQPEIPVPTTTQVPNATPTATRPPTNTPLPTATATPGGGTYQGEVVQTFPNCGLTQVFGVVHDPTGNPQPGTRIRLTWDGNTTPLYTTAGTYVRPETDTSGWDFVLANFAMENWWRVAVVDGAGNPLSPEVVVHTVNRCEPTDLNVAKVRFREN